MFTSCNNTTSTNNATQNATSPKEPTSSTSQEQTPAPTQDLPYKALIAIDICQYTAPEAAEDAGFYMIKIEDALEQLGIKTQRLPEQVDMKKVEIKAPDGTVVKTVDLTNIVTSDNCVGFLVARDGAQHQFIALDPLDAEKKIKAYFK